MLASADRILETEYLPESVAYNMPGLYVGKIYDEMSYMEMESVTFGYGRENVIEDGSVRINKGDFTVISGISGIGKSTFFKLSYRGAYTAKGQYKRCVRRQKIFRP